MKIKRYGRKEIRHKFNYWIFAHWCHFIVYVMATINPLQKNLRNKKKLSKNKLASEAANQVATELTITNNANDNQSAYRSARLSKFKK